MSKLFKGNVTNNVVELNLLNPTGTPTTVTRNTAANAVTQVVGDISTSDGFDSDATVKGLVIGTSCTSIGSDAFKDCWDGAANGGAGAGLTGSLVIPDSVMSIGSYAFYSCSGLTGDLVIPDSVTSIGDFAFNGCTNLTGSLIIGNSVTSIGSYAFSDVDSLMRVIADSVTSIGDYAFAYNFTSTTDYEGCPASSFTGSNAFYGCDLLNTLYAKDAVSNGYTLGLQTFQGLSITIANWDNYPNPIPN